VRLLVTGGAGFIGSHYVRTLLSGGYPGYEDAEVTVLDKLTYAGNPANLEPVSGHFTFVRGDICDARLLAGLLPGHDAVVNFAAETHVDRSIAGAAEFVTANVAGVQVLMDACHNADRKGHDRRYSLNDSLLRSTGYAPRVPFPDGLKATIAWYAGNRQWWKPLDRPAPPAEPATGGNRS
jgi:dTDP-D-glucose 4,6-dehydratase